MGFLVSISRRSSQFRGFGNGSGESLSANEPVSTKICSKLLSYVVDFLSDCLSDLDLLPGPSLDDDTLEYCKKSDKNKLDTRGGGGVLAYPSQI